MLRKNTNKLALSKTFPAFTLAEVLITLGIIGVVAAMTIPVLLATSRKSVTETRLKKFYSSINQAIKLSEIENGDKKNWDVLPGTTAANVLVWYDKYLKDYLRTVSVDSTTLPKQVIVYLPDGSAFMLTHDVWSFFPEAKDAKPYILADKSSCGIKYFLFLFNPADTVPSMVYHYNKGVEPYSYTWDGTDNQLRTDSDFGCKPTVNVERGFCTRLIQINNWKIPDDYPLSF